MRRLDTEHLNSELTVLQIKTNKQIRCDVSH